jgi:hypothetical protein
MVTHGGLIMVDRLIIEQAHDTIELLYETLEKGTYDRQTGYDIGKAISQIRNLLGWLKSIDRERDHLDKGYFRLAKENHILKSKLDKPVEDDTLTVTRFD